MTGGKDVPKTPKIEHHDLVRHQAVKSDSDGGERGGSRQDAQEEADSRTQHGTDDLNDPGSGQESEKNLRRRNSRSKLENDRAKLVHGLEVKDQDPLASIPEAVMREYLLKYLETREDKQNLSQASPSAADLIGISKWNWRFNELFQIPNFQDLFSKREILSFRLVSLDWRWAIDTIWEATNDIDPDPNYSSYISILSSPSTLADYGRRAFQRKPLCLLPDLAGSTTTKIDKFLGETDLHPGNPFISRMATFLSFSDGNNENDRDYWRQVLVVLDKFGRDLRSLQIRSYSGFTTAQMLDTIKECLEGVPQLSTLHLTLFSLLISTGRGDDDPNQFPVFPPLPNLTRLSISHGKWPIHQPLAIYFDQLVSLEVRNSEMFMGWYDHRIHSTFPKLKHFAVCIDREEELGKLQFLTSPLREIDIKSRLSNLCPSVYFHFLAHFRETLRACKIHQNFNCHSPIKTLEAYGLPEEDSAQAHLPRLNNLSLNITECAHLPVEQFLILADSLEYLELVVESRPCHVQSHEYLTNMEDSKLWKLLPYLQEIHVRYDPILRSYKRPNKDKDN